MAPSGQPRGLLFVGGVTVLFAILSGIVVTRAGASSGPRCSSYLDCLVTPSGFVNSFHLLSAGLLLLLSLITVLLAIRWRAQDPRLLLLGIAALAVLLIMAAVGGLLATGVVPIWASVLQFGLLAVFVILNAVLLERAARSSRSRRSGVVRTHDPSEVSRGGAGEGA
jgi:heme A synthase